MEEILASIRRIIADDEAKPAAAEPAEAKPAAAEKPASPPPPKPEPPAAKAPAMKDIPPSAIAAPKPAAARQARAAACAGAGRQQQPGRHRRDAGGPRRGDAGGRHPAGAARRADVFELTDEMAVPDPAAGAQSVVPQDRPAGRHRIRRERRRQGAAPAAGLRAAAVRKRRRSSPQQQILSRSTVSAVESAFNTLANTVLSNNARTLEDLVKEMLRPMLKSWLDDNLPGLVERIVKAEIERVSRGR